MDFVQPIRDRKKISQIKNLLRGQKRFRDLLLFVVGINSALRVSDMLGLTVADFVDPDGQPRASFLIRESKRGKRTEVVINEAIRDALREELAAYPGITDNPEHFVFFNQKRGGYTQPVSRKLVWRMISELCADVGLAGNYGTHSLRKTWGYHARMNGVAMALIMHKLNHANVQVTKRYLGITDDEVGEIVRRLNLYSNLVFYSS